MGQTASLNGTALLHGGGCTSTGKCISFSRFLASALCHRRCPSAYTRQWPTLYRLLACSLHHRQHCPSSTWPPLSRSSAPRPPNKPSPPPRERACTHHQAHHAEMAARSARHQHPTAIPAHAARPLRAPARRAWVTGSLRAGHLRAAPVRRVRHHAADRAGVEQDDAAAAVFRVARRGGRPQAGRGRDLPAGRPGGLVRRSGPGRHVRGAHDVRWLPKHTGERGF